MIEKTLISRKTLAERWDFESTKVIENYEAEGIITRVPGLKAPRYSLEEILKIEGTELNPLSPLERRRMEKELEEKDKLISFLQGKLNKIKEML